MRMDSGGVYHGRIKLPPQYPLKPPSIEIFTPNGRFETHKRICLSLSDYHPETWNPNWSSTAVVVTVALAVGVWGGGKSFPGVFRALGLLGCLFMNRPHICHAVRTVILALISFMPSDPEGIGAVNFPPKERRRLAVASHDYACEVCTPLPEVALWTRRGHTHMHTHTCTLMHTRTHATDITGGDAARAAVKEMEDNAAFLVAHPESKMKDEPLPDFAITKPPPGAGGSDEARAEPATTSTADAADAEATPAVSMDADPNARGAMARLLRKRNLSGAGPSTSSASVPAAATPYAPMRGLCASVPLRC